MTKAKPEVEMMQALRQFRQQHGRLWKSKLRKLWASGKDSGWLRYARNTLGSYGLDRLQF